MAFVLRRWQSEAIERVKEFSRSIVEACPGSGKSAFSGGLAKHWIESGACDHVLAVAPSESIKRSVMRQWKGNWGLRVRSRLVQKSGNAFKIPRAFDATVITYHELKNQQCEDALRLWCNDGWKFGVVFDEIHHAASNQTWGNRVRVIGHDLASRVCVMTGTPFRSDGQPIELMEYVVRDGEAIADPHYQYTYRNAVEEDICRPVTCRWIEGVVTLVHRDKGLYKRDISKVQSYEMKEAMARFFDPRSEVMQNLIRCVHADLVRLRSTPEYANAGALFVCRPGKPGDADSDKHVREMAKAIERITGDEVCVVTHDDKDSADRIDQFERSNAPYIAAVNMVSEGVDIPRLRFVAFCRHTESEMLFRQIVGRVIRKTRDNDEVAAQVYVPAFSSMMEFGNRLWDEAKAGMRERVTAGVIACPRCNQCPCNCERDDAVASSPKIIGIDAHGNAGDGRLDQIDVEKMWIDIAENVMKTHVTYKNWNQVHLGACLKTASQLHGNNTYLVNEEQLRSNLCDRLVRRINVLARLAHEGEYGKAWRVELFNRYQVESLDDIKALWTHDKIESAIREIEKRIDATIHAPEAAQ